MIMRMRCHMLTECKMETTYQMGSLNGPNYQLYVTQVGAFLSPWMNDISILTVTIVFIMKNNKIKSVCRLAKVYFRQLIKVFKN